MHSEDQIVVEHQLDKVLSRVSKTLEQLSVACADVQSVSVDQDMATSNDALVKTQALDRVTQTLACLSEFSAAVAALPSVQSICVGEAEFSRIGLPSVREALSTDIDSKSASDFEDVTIF